MHKTYQSCSQVGSTFILAFGKLVGRMNFIDERAEESSHEFSGSALGGALQPLQIDKFTAKLHLRKQSEQWSESNNIIMLQIK